MVQTMTNLVVHASSALEQRGIKRAVNCVVWAHNSHIGDASATSHAERTELNVGQFVRQVFM